jgi:hypothetical protein
LMRDCLLHTCRVAALTSPPLEKHDDRVVKPDVGWR